MTLKACTTPGRVVAGVAIVVVIVQAFRPAFAQPNQSPLAPYIKVNAPVIALTHVRVIDGTGAGARENQTLVIRDGSIAAIGDAGSTLAPDGATVIDLTGKSVFPGLVMMHEHLYYTTGPGVYGQLGVSFSRLYLAGGVTTMRTAGNTNGIMDVNVSRRIAAGEMPGPAIDATAPYVNGPSSFLQMHALKDADEARKHVAYWADQGSTSLKAYMQISRAALQAASSRSIPDVRVATRGARARTRRFPKAATCRGDRRPAARKSSRVAMAS